MTSPIAHSLHIQCKWLADDHQFVRQMTQHSWSISHSRQEAQLMLTNLRDAFRGHSRSPNIVPFHMLGILSSCAIITLSLRRAVFLIFDFTKCRDLEIRVRGHSRHWKWYHRLCMFYRNTVPKMHRFWDSRNTNAPELPCQLSWSGSIQILLCHVSSTLWRVTENGTTHCRQGCRSGF